MAKPQVKPLVGGSFADVPGNGKANTTVAALPPGLAHQAIYASNVFTFANTGGGGVTGTRAVYANKVAAAAKVVLQWV